MIQTQKLLNAINNRIITWEFSDVFDTLIQAKKAAIKIYTQHSIRGATVKQILDGRFILLFWTIGE